MKVEDFKKFRDMVAVEIKNALRLLTMQQGATNHKLDLVYERLEKVEDKVDAIFVDVVDLKDEVKALGDKIDSSVEKTEREISGIKEDLGLPS